MGDGLTLRQRGAPAVLTRDDYRRGWDVYLSVLELHRIVRVQPSGEHVLVHPNQFVGLARCPTGVVRIAPRFPDLLTELKRTFPFQRRAAGLPAYKSAATQTSGTDLPAAFMARLAEVLDSGFPFAYRRAFTRSSTLSGSLDITRTVREFDSVGIHHRAVVRQTRRRHDEPLLSVVWTAANVLEEEGVLGLSESADLGRIMRAMPAPPGPVSRREALLLLGEVDQDAREDVSALCDAAESLLRGSLSVDDVEYASGDVSFTFTDVDALWERAVHLCLNDAASTAGMQARFHPLSGIKTWLYPDGGPDIDPDVVIYKGELPVAVADAKDFAEAAAEASGVYQVDSYARRLNVRHASLFYLAAGSEWTESFGDSALRVTAVGIVPDGTTTLARLRVAAHAFVNGLS